MPQAKLNYENHKEMLTGAYAQIMDPDAAKLLAEAVINNKVDDLDLSALGTQLRGYKELAHALGDKKNGFVVEAVSARVQKYFGGKGALEFPPEVAFKKLFEQGKQVSQLSVRLKEYKQLSNELNQQFGADAGTYVDAHIAAQLQEYFGEDKPNHRGLKTSTEHFLNDDLWMRVKSCAAEITKENPHANSAERKAFLALPEDTVHAVLDRVKEYQLHWESKQPLAAPSATIAVPTTGKEMLIPQADKLVR